MNKSRTVLAVTALVSTLAITACADPTSDEASGAPGENCTPVHPNVRTITEGTLTVGHFPNPPFADSEGNTLTGVEGEVLSRIAERECLSIRIVRGNVASMIPSVESGRADTTLGSWYRTAERAKVVRLSDPVITVHLAIASRKGSGIEQIGDLPGHVVGSAIGSLWVEDVNRLIGNDQKLYETLEASYADLKAGRIEAILNSQPTAVRQIEMAGLQNEVQVVVPKPDDAVKATLHPGQTNFPVHLQNASLQEAINDGLAELRKTGELRKILEKYGIPADADNPQPLQTF
ncbi:transporter substrate-binding domain-containing protein [Phytohabitans sp. ZYX-F-186]|uniref:Transporter substrate-binding domain-containing protein n=1 Tax=Phytohabitans maris TaxID=3071409 RepID=A0ABU0ZZG2_9ACTN|nr:transporter substrate-binding domain-containing protein [Phytohabitans sp. ZYX-F-186]MDQ7911362.1 transporter substrate-binding domain-containing protein [Phytohabitans sp. ZYX-F-186]